MGEILKELPAVILRGSVLLPGVVSHFDISTQRSIHAVEAAMNDDNHIFLVTQKDMQTEHAKQEDVYTVGVVAEIKQIVKMQNHVVRVIVESKQKAELAYFIEKEEFLKAQVVLEEKENVQEQLPPEVEEAMLRSLQEKLLSYCTSNPKIGKELKKQAEENGLIFDIVESVPVPEEIKLGTEKADEYTEVYCENIRRCAKYGVKCITYNFMPVFDWTRTQLDKEAADGSTSLVMYMDQLKSLDPLKDDIHLPGWDASYTQAEVRDLIKAYSALGEEGLWHNLEKFLKKIIPVAEDCGVTMAIHPDDPPYPIFGIPRIITNERNIDRMLNIVDSPANSLCFCTGSLGCAAFNDIPKMVRKYSKMGRIAFMHIRQVKLLEDGSFEERGHLSKDGSLDMYETVKALVDTGFDGYVRPDHGRMIWGESGKPGYGLFDRALGAAYINGLFEAAEKEKK